MGFLVSVNLVCLLPFKTLTYFYSDTLIFFYFGFHLGCLFECPIDSVSGNQFQSLYTWESAISASAFSFKTLRRKQSSSFTQIDEGRWGFGHFECNIALADEVVKLQLFWFVEFLPIFPIIPNPLFKGRPSIIKVPKLCHGHFPNLP